MNIMIYAPAVVSGKEAFSKAFARSQGLSFVSLDHQDGGRLESAYTAVDSVFDCEPYFEQAIAVAPYSNKMIYVLSPKNFVSAASPSVAKCIQFLADEVAQLKAINPDLSISFVLSDSDVWPDDLKQLLSDLVGRQF